MSQSSFLKGRKLLVGVTGGIAAYKVTNLIRLFKKAGAEVQVLMTPSATRFITPLTLGTLSEREVLIEIFPENEDGSWTKHVHLGLWADLFIICPGTAQTIAKLAHGFCDSMITAVALSARCPLLVCPAMDHDMYVHPSTQANLDILRSYGYEVMEPDHGLLASGLTGQGRLPEPADIFTHAVHKLGIAQTPLSDSQTLAGKKVLVTAGPTREPLDPVRFLSNHSTGTMGYALAEAAVQRGGTVTLISGPTKLATPANVTRIDITTADDMHAAVQQHKDADLVIMAAAIADFAPETIATSKIKKNGEAMTVRLRRTPDVLAALGHEKREGQVLVGFAMETDDARANAQRKLETKNLDWIVLNNLHEPGAGFGTTTNRVTLMHHSGASEDLPLMAKKEVADALLQCITDAVTVEAKE